jgi:hypothetical protein
MKKSKMKNWLSMRGKLNRSMKKTKMRRRRR